MYIYIYLYSFMCIVHVRSRNTKIPGARGTDFNPLTARLLYRPRACAQNASGVLPPGCFVGMPSYAFTYVHMYTYIHIYIYAYISHI